MCFTHSSLKSECSIASWNSATPYSIHILFTRYKTHFPKSLTQCLHFRHILRSRIQKLDLFWGPKRFLGASEAKKQKNNHHSTIFWANNKLNYLWDKLIDFLFFNEVLKNLIFYHISIKTKWLKNTNYEQTSNSKSLFVINL